MSACGPHRRWSRRQLIAWIGCAPLAACNFPLDSVGTLARVRSGAPLRVGACDAPPWVRTTGTSAHGVETTLIRDFAQQLGAAADFVSGGESQIMQALHQRQLDVVVAGLTDDTPWSTRGGLSQPYLTTRVRFGIGQGATEPKTWRGERVVVPAERVRIAGLVAREGAEPVAPSGSNRLPAAGYDFELRAAGLQPVGPELAREHHVIAVAGGENALLLALDRFLLGLGEAEMSRRAEAEVG